MADQSLLATMTGEHFQPVRLHYKVLNRSGLLRAFEKLRCLDYDSTRKRWVWLYAHEARNYDSRSPTPSSRKSFSRS
jgi:hypothetical protein